MSKKVLFVTPVEVIRSIIQTRLRQEDYEVLLASDGEEAWNILSEGNSVDLLITEEFLPYKSGMELISKCSSMDLPSILISDVDAESKILHAFELGAYDFIDKPYSPNELVVRVKNIFEHYRK